MEFNYNTEKRKFEQNWAKFEAFYRKNGMPEESIQKMYEYEWDQFKAARIEAIHTQEMGFQPDDDDDKVMMDSPLFKKFFEQFTSEYDTYSTHSRFWWLEELCDPRLVAALPRLTDEDKELLTLVIMEGYSQEECAVKMHSSQSAISRKFIHIIDIFTKN